MYEGAESLLRALLIGVGATAIMDLWALLLRSFGIPSLDWAMVGRWLGNIPRGQLAHTSIAAAAPVPGERALGWLAHYLVGVLFAALLLTLCGPEWAHQPTPLPALLFGLASVSAPFFIMQPALGAGLAARRTPAPWRARRLSLLTHFVFGIGLYIAALCTAVLLPA